MRIEQLIVQHLYKTKKVSLEGIGFIYLNPSVVLPAEGEKDFTMPENAFTFEYNLKATQDLSLIDFIVEQTKKIKPLATSDLESFLILAKQFLNIGKPLVIEGVGTIQKSQGGDYEFKSGIFITSKIDDYPKQLKEKTDDNVSFESESKPNNSRRNLMIAFSLFVTALVGLSIYYFIFSKRNVTTEPLTNQVMVAPKDSLQIDTSLSKKIDSSTLAAPATVIKIDSNSFKIILKDYPNLSAAKTAFGKLEEYGHKVIIISKDSPVYKIAMPFARPLSDTTKVKDSIRKFFGGNPTVLLQ